MQKEISAHSQASSAAEEVISGIRTVFAFSGQKKESKRYEDLLIPAMKNGFKRSFATSLISAINYGVLYVNFGLGIWYGCKLILEKDGDYTIGNVVIVFWGIIGCGYNIGSAAPFFEALQIGRTAAAKIYQVIEKSSKIDSTTSDGKRLESEFEANIELKGVHFRYPTRSDVPILKGLNLNIANGEIIALVGASGCGKSTIIQLIQRFYDPDQGEILLNGVSLKHLNLGWLREQLSVVGQEPVLFDDTIEQNIRLGLPTDRIHLATKEDLEHAAKMANAHEFISKLPEGYSTYVGDRGAQLSGGQKQRIAIARALISKPRILLLDEATSALDLKSEHLVQAALDRASQGRTTIIVAHRLSTIINADRIVYLENGQVLEMGTHQELMDKQSAYYGLVQAQKVNDVEKRVTKEADPTPVLYKSITVFNQNIASRSGSISSTTSNIMLNAATLEEDEVKPEIMEAIVKQRFPYGRLLAMIMNDKLYLVIAILCSFVFGATTPIYALIFGNFVEVFATGSEEAQREESIRCAIIFVCLGIVSFTVICLQVSGKQFFHDLEFTNFMIPDNLVRHYQ